MLILLLLPLCPVWAAFPPTADGPICPSTNGSQITVTSGSSKYLMPVPANKTVFSVLGQDQQLGCIGPTGAKYSMCLPCNFPVNQLEVTTEAGICFFTISGRTGPVHNKRDEGPLTITPPSQVLEVECGLAQ